MAAGAEVNLGVVGTPTLTETEGRAAVIPIPGRFIPTVETSPSNPPTRFPRSPGEAASAAGLGATVGEGVSVELGGAVLDSLGEGVVLLETAADDDEGEGGEEAEVAAAIGVIASKGI